MRRAMLLSVLLVATVCCLLVGSSGIIAEASSESFIYDQNGTALTPTGCTWDLSYECLFTDYWVDWTNMSFTYGFDVTDSNFNYTDNLSSDLKDSNLRFLKSKDGSNLSYELGSPNLLSEHMQLMEYNKFDSGAIIGDFPAFDLPVTATTNNIYTLYYTITRYYIETSGFLAGKRQHETINLSDVGVYVHNFNGIEVLYGSFTDSSDFSTYYTSTGYGRLYIFNRCILYPSGFYYNPDRCTIIFRPNDGDDPYNYDFSVTGITLSSEYSDIDVPALNGRGIFQDVAYKWSDYKYLFDDTEADIDLLAGDFSFELQYGIAVSSYGYMTTLLPEETVKRKYNFNEDYLYFIFVDSYTYDGTLVTADTNYCYVLMYYQYPLESIQETVSLTDFWKLTEISDKFTLAGSSSSGLIYYTFSVTPVTSCNYPVFNEFYATLDVKYSSNSYKYVFYDGSYVTVNQYNDNSLTYSDSRVVTILPNRYSCYNVPSDNVVRFRGLNNLYVDNSGRVRSDLMVGFSFTNLESVASAAKNNLDYSGDLMDYKDVSSGDGWDRFSARCYNAVADFVNSNFIKKIYSATIGVYNWIKHFFNNYLVVFSGLGILSVFLLGGFALIVIFKLRG